MRLPKGPPVLHPFLWAAFPVLFLFAHNRSEGIARTDLIGPLELTLGVVAVLLLTGWLLLKDPHRAGLVLAGWILLFFSFGRIARLLEGQTLLGVGAEAWLLLAWGLLAADVVFVASRLRPRLRSLTQSLNLIAGALVLLNLVPILASGTGRGAEPATALPSTSAAPVRNGRLPDIYLIVPDRFGNEQTLRDTYGVDVHPFIQFLRGKGFYVADRSHSNYQNTHQSLASSLNMELLTPAKASSAYARLHGFAVARYLKAIGYRYVHIGSWWEPTRRDSLADVNISYSSWSEFADALYETTMLPAIVSHLGVAENTLDRRRRAYSKLMAEFRALEHSRLIDGPKFVFAHILFPHNQGPGYVVDRMGRYRSQKDESSRTYRQLYGDQAVFAAKKLQEVITGLLSDPTYKPVIILLTDEGPYPSERVDGNPSTEDWRDFSPSQLKDKFRVLNAMYLPGVDHHALYPTMTPVNEFRMIFNLYFGANLPLLPDRSFVQELEPFGLLDITDRLKE